MRAMRTRALWVSNPHGEAQTKGAPAGPSNGASPHKGADVWWGFGIALALIWVILFFMFAFTALAKGHWMMFIIGFFLPIFWIIGALIEPTARAEGAR
jgi:hypothetical protein